MSTRYEHSTWPSGPFSWFLRVKNVDSAIFDKMSCFLHRRMVTRTYSLGRISTTRILRPSSEKFAAPHAQ